MAQIEVGPPLLGSPVPLILGAAEGIHGSVVDGLGVGIVGEQRVVFGETLIQRQLQRMVGGEAERIVARDAAEHAGQVGTPLFDVGAGARGGRNGRIEVAQSGEAGAFRTDVGSGEDNAVQGLLLDVEVPLLHVRRAEVGIQRFAHHDGPDKVERAPRFRRGWRLVGER